MSVQEARDWLVEHVAEAANVRPREIDVREPFTSYGLTSRDAVGISGELEDWLGAELPPTLLYEHPSVESLARHLAGETDAAGRDVETTEGNADMPVAIVGIGCRFPGADGPRAFWQLLKDGVDAISEVPRERWDHGPFFDPTSSAPGKTNTRWGGFLSEIERFDSHFFSISAMEAARMDPQQRLLLEVTWEAFEDAGLVAEKIAGTRTGVFVGVSGNEYGRLQQSDPALIDAYAATGNALSIAANRISYTFDLRGPSAAVDTACSSSLVAVHMACQSLWSGESTLAIAAGANLILSPALAIGFTRAGVMAADGRCKTFDSRADGYVRGEGVGVVVLKPLAQALADGDPVYAVIRGTSINQDGRTNGLMAPNPQSQEEMLREAYRRACVEPRQVQYVEAHGTGTLLGDPIEAKALGAVLGAGREPGSFCAVGSVKSNVGHLEAAAGLTGLIKVALSLKHRTLPRSLHFQQPNPHINFEELGLRVQSEPGRWPDESRKLLAGVSSFGFGGTNAHAVLEEAPRAEVDAGASIVEAEEARVLPLSARGVEALDALARSYADFLSEEGPALEDVCYTASVRRSQHDYRLAVTAPTRAGLREAIERHLAGEGGAGVYAGRRRAGQRPKLVFVFSGQGSQWAGMGRELLAREPVFRETVERCDNEIRRETGWSVIEKLEHGEPLEGIDVIQPVLFAVQVALTELWRSWGVEPDAVVGHSMGEVAAAYAAGALSLEDAARVICRRSQLLKRIGGLGSMAVVELSLDNAQLAIKGYEDRLSVAVSNGPKSSVLSGETGALEEVLKDLRLREVFCREVKVDVAAHSPQTDALREEMLGSLDELSPRAASVPFYSTVAGMEGESPRFDADYWARNMRERVLFYPATRRMLEDGHSIFLEISPHPILSHAIHEALKQSGEEGAALASLRREEGERATLSAGLAALYASGHEVDWSRLYARPGRCVPLPTYAWQKERYWFDLEENAAGAAGALWHVGGGAKSHLLLGHHVALAQPEGCHLWEVEIGVGRLPFLKDHRLRGSVVLPATVFVEMALAAASEAAGADCRSLAEVRFHSALFLPDEGARRLQLVLHTRAGAEMFFQIFSGPEGAPDWTLHVSGKVRRNAESEASRTHEEFTPELFATNGAGETAGADFYIQLEGRGHQYGPSFRGVEQLWRGAGEAWGRVSLPAGLSADDYSLHPALADACWQVMGGALAFNAGDEGVYVPVSVEEVKVYGDARGRLWCHARLRDGREDESHIVEGDTVVYDEGGRVVAEFAGLCCQRVEASAKTEADETLEEWLYELQWQERALEPKAQVHTSTEDSDECCLIFTDAGGFGQRLAAQLGERGVRCVLVGRGESFECVDESHFLLRPASLEDVSNLLGRVAGGYGRLSVIFLWSLDIHVAEGHTPASLEAAQTLGCFSVLSLVQGLVGAGLSDSTRLALVTRGAQAITTDDAPPPAVEQTPLWGLGRVIALEHPELKCLRVDFDPKGSARDALALIEELSAGDAEDQIAYRTGTRYVLRLARTQGVSAAGGADAPGGGEPLPVPAAENFRLEAGTPSGLEGLTLRAATRTAPMPGEVEIEVSAAGLNFRDVMKLMGIYPGTSRQAVQFGDECAGRIVALGEGVEGFAVGDEVIAVAPRSMSAYTLTRSSFVAPKPARLSQTEAATLPVAYSTALYALKHVGRLAAGERVLIHAAAGGVGLAAVRIALSSGAEVFATAGNDEKREFLRGLGVHHISDSRSLEFEDEVLRATSGEGVDLVLNSLSGEALQRSLALLRPFGRFVEIGKTDIYQNRQVGLLALRNNVTLSTVDMDQLFRERPALAESVLHEVVRRVDEGDFAALPHTTFTVEEAANAFRYMAQRKNTGKVVLNIERRNEVETATNGLASSRSTPVRADATYLITGGLGGLGLTVARWMAGEGARHLVLLGRKGARGPAAETVEELRRAGVRVVVACADIADAEELTRLLAEVDETMPPLRGIVHAAGVLDDGILLQQDSERFSYVMRPKMAGAWNLHRSSVQKSLDFFLLFSSAASLIGSPGQGNYAAANAFLDGLAAWRRAQGLPALSINWGPWSEVGLAARPGRGGQLAQRGFKSIAPEQGVTVLKRLFRAGGPASAHVGVIPIDWREWRRAGAPLDLPLFAGLDCAAEDAPRQTANGGKVSRASLLAAAPEERQQIVETHLRALLKRVVGHAASTLDAAQPLSDLGLDSLMAIELKNRIENDLGVAVPVVSFLKGLSLTQLATQVQDLAAASPSTPHASPVTCADAEPALDEVNELSDEEVDAMLGEMLAHET
ncbi:MAG TPA: SDR family NAD(P)-dependent oxidoreductase [Pyrinomonadaceae bacterium]